MTINCFKCGQEIAFNKNILSKTGKQIPLWVDQQNTHGHDDQGNPTRGPLPEAQSYNMDKGMGVGLQHPQIKPKYVEETKTGGLPGPNDRPSLESVLLNQINQKIDQKFDELKKFIESLTVMDTAKFTGQMQQFHDDVIPFLKTNFKIASELDQDKAREEKRKREVEEQSRWNNKVAEDVEDLRGNKEEVVTDDDEQVPVEEDVL